MKVTMLRSPGTAWDCELTEGQTGEVDNVTGRRLVAAGLAVDVSEPKPEVNAIPPQPAIAEPKPTVIEAPAKTTAKVNTPKPAKSSLKSGGKTPNDKDK